MFDGCGLKLLRGARHRATCLGIWGPGRLHRFAPRRHLTSGDMTQSRAPAAWFRADATALATSDNLDDAVATIDRYQPHDDAQRRCKADVLDFVASHDDALHRSCAPGHLTASCWVVNHEGDRGLILFHAKIKRWVQPGGHADGDANLAAVALREATEETGIEHLEVWSTPIDIDIHLFVNRAKVEPDHLHHDLRFIVRAPPLAHFSGNHESEELRWVGLAELDSAALDLDASTVRLARAGFATGRLLS